MTVPGSMAVWRVSPDQSSPMEGFPFRHRVILYQVMYYLKEDSAKTGSREETIADDLRKGQAASRAGGEAEAERRDLRLWDQIVTDLPQVHVVSALQWSEIHSPDIELE